MIDEPDHSPEKAAAASVRALVRGLQILEYINENKDTRPSSIARALSMPRATVCRILDTLEQNGYTTRYGSSGKPLISAKTAKIGEIYSSKTRILEIASPLMRAAHREIIWPVDLVRRVGSELVIFESTHGLSPYSTEEKILGRRLPFFGTASGHCYLAFCSEAERAEIMHLLELGLDGAQRESLADQLRRVLAAASVGAGYASNGILAEKGGVSAFSVPVLAEGKLVACVTLAWPKRAMKMQDSVAKYLDNMKKLSTNIARNL